MEKKSIDPSTIPGWGIDADPNDQPNYPIKKYTGDDHQRSNWQRPVQQQSEVEILKSSERPSISAVFGTHNPPRFLSGMLRRFAFKYSENLYRHWLPLLLADRIDVVESEIEEVVNGHFPGMIDGQSRQVSEEQDPLLSRKILLRLGAFVAVTALVAYQLNKKEKNGISE